MGVRVRMNVREGVARGLCGTCEHAHIVADDRGKQTVRCDVVYAGAVVINRPIAQCNMHAEKNVMDRRRAEEMGWVLEVKAGRVVGFKPPTKKHDD